MSVTKRLQPSRILAQFSFSGVLALLVGMGIVACSSPDASSGAISPESTPEPALPAEPTSGGEVQTPTSSSPTQEKAQPTPATVEKETCTFGIQTANGCAASYDVRMDNADDLEGFSASCADGKSMYNNCTAAPLTFQWKDAGSAMPKSVRVEMQTSIFCADPNVATGVTQVQTVSFNSSSAPFGSFESDLASCTCAASGKERTFELDAAALANYKAGKKNAVRIGGTNRCIGMKKNPAWDGAIARITVTY